MTRITNSMITSNFLRNLNSNMTAMEKLNNELSTMKKIQKPSDDPAGLSKVLRLKNGQNQVDQYVKNVDNAKNWLDITDTALDEVGQLLQRAQELATQGANATYTAEDRQQSAAEVQQILHEMVELGNSSYEGKYIFAGFRTDAPPFKLDAATNTVIYQGDSGGINAEISQGVTMQYNLTGDAVFGDSSQGLLSKLANLYNAFKNDDVNGISQGIDDMQKALDSILKFRGEVGAKTNRLDFSKNRLTANGDNLANLRSQVEDVDTAQAIMQLKNEENVYRAALSSGAQIIQPTLVDFLK